MTETFIPEDFLKASWFYTGDSYVFGIRNGETIVKKYAMTKRKPDGSCDWAIDGTHFQGNEPSNELAMEKVNNLFLSAIDLREALS